MLKRATGTVVFQVMGDPAEDMVILDAPGQQDVWNYYDPGLPVLALPQERPPDEANVVQTLASETAGHRRIFALFWATDEADPDRIVEGWLDQHGFRGLESWQGNVRFVVYTLPTGLACEELVQPVPFGDAIHLDSVCSEELLSALQPIQPGKVALVGLTWRATAPVSEQYKVSVQLLDPRNQVVAQHDSAPAGGTMPTDTWQPDQEITDNHGLTIPFGTPPGEYRLIVAMYNSADGQRLPTPAGIELELGALPVAQPAQPVPPSIVPMQRRVNAPLGPVTLLGYNSHRKDFSHAPETPVRPGDTVHFSFFWQAPAPLPAGWEANTHFTLQLGNETLHAPLAGDAYPTGQWQAGELVRGEFDILFTGDDPVPVLHVGDSTLRLHPVPD